MTSDQITAEIIKDSIGPNGKRITTFLCIYPLIVHAEHLRHRTQSFSVASQRAIPAKKIQEQVAENPFVPIAFQKTHKGMQGTDYLEGEDHNRAVHYWETAADNALSHAERLTDCDVTKQLANRIVSPFILTRVVCTATEWDGFFSLRIHDAAEIHIRELAVKMKAAMAESTPQELKQFQWHLPFIENDDIIQVKELLEANLSEASMSEKLIKISAARCAFTSYDKNRGLDIHQELKVAEDKLIPYRHWSPFEHQAQAIHKDSKPNSKIMVRNIVDGVLNCQIQNGLEIRYNGETLTYWSRNFQGWLQARAKFDFGEVV